MKVIGAGFGRTGTMSLKVALEELGFGPCYHMIEVFEHPEHLPLWEAAAQGEPVDWEKLLAGYQSTVDWPGCTFYKDLMKAYPDVKVLLNVRDSDKWYESARNTIYAAVNIPDPPPGRRMVDKLIWEQTFDGNFENRQHAIEVFEQHNEEVIQNPSSRWSSRGERKGTKAINTQRGWCVQPWFPTTLVGASHHSGLATMPKNRAAC